MFALVYRFICSCWHVPALVLAPYLNDDYLNHHVCWITGLFHQAVCKLRGNHRSVCSHGYLIYRWKTSAAENQRKQGLDRDGFSGYFSNLSTQWSGISWFSLYQFPHVNSMANLIKIWWILSHMFKQTSWQTQVYPCQMVGATPLSKLRRCCLKPRKFRHIHHASQGSIFFYNGSTTWLPVGGIQYSDSTIQLLYPLVMTNIANWKITMLLMGKLTISMAIFNSYVTNYQRVDSYIDSIFP